METPTSLTPEVINELFQSACQFHQEGQLDEAKELYLKLLDQIDAPLLHYNLGLIHFALAENETACSYFAHAHEADPFDSDSLFNLALCQKNCGRYEDACRSYKKLLEFEADNVDTLYNLASCYREMQDEQAAISTYLDVLKRRPEHKSALSNVAFMYQLTDETEQAIHYYRKLLAIAPDDYAAQHMLSSLSGNTPDSPPESYVRDLFNNYSDHYEESLIANLRYDVPVQLRTHLDTLQSMPSSYRYGIDLGCGTGLSGMAFQDIVTNFTGVDLSEKMIAIAQKKSIYQSLIVSSISNALQQIAINFDLAIAADVFAYIGDLEETFQLLSQNTAENAVFCFSTETTSNKKYSLRSSGRFAHSPDYIVALAKKHGWSIVLQQTTQLRMEKGQWVTGNLWILKRSVSGT